MSAPPRVVRVGVLAAVFGLCGVYAVMSPAHVPARNVDQVMYRETVSGMKHGQDYYRAMDAALRRHGGAVSSTRAFREPAPFLLWRWLPSGVTWLTFVALAGLTGLILLRVTSVPLVVPLVVFYLLNAARPRIGNAWVDQDLFVELWVVPLVAALLLAWRRGHDWAAALLAAAATIARELTAGLLVGGLIAAQLLRRPRKPWLVAGATAVAAYAVHTALTSSHLVAHGHEMALLGTGGPHRAATMMGVAMPWPVLVGPALWVLAVGRLATDRKQRALLALYATLPLTGFFIGRDYWGFLVAPFTIMWAAEAVVAIYERLFAPVTTST